MKRTKSYDENLNKRLLNKDYVKEYLNSIRQGLSSFAVLTNPHEYFAETGATLYFDSQSKSYIPEQLQRWYFEYVLK